jgi:hypothetical protein
VIDGDDGRDWLGKPAWREPDEQEQDENKAGNRGSSQQTVHALSPDDEWLRRGQVSFKSNSTLDLPRRLCDNLPAAFLPADSLTFRCRTA